ncbi:unnamed protein product, partial [Ectocarpus sp. 13 AM-2016]
IERQGQDARRGVRRLHRGKFGASHIKGQVAIELQVLLRQVVLRAEGAPEDAARHSRLDVKEAAAPAVAAPSRAGAGTARAGISSGTGSTSRRKAEEG